MTLSIPLKNKLVECHKEYNEKIESMNLLIENLQSKINSQEPEKIEIQKNTITQIRKINERLQTIESKLEENGIKFESIDKRCKVHSSEIFQMDSYIKDKLESVEKICKDLNEHKHNLHLFDRFTSGENKSIQENSHGPDRDASEVNEVHVTTSSPELDTRPNRSGRERTKE